MIKVKFPTAQSLAVVDVFDCRECGPDTICGDMGFTEDSLRSFVGAVLKGDPVELPEAKWEQVVDELDYYHGIRRDPALKRAMVTIAHTVAKAKGLDFLVPKPRPRKPKPKPVMEPTVKHKVWKLRAPEGANGYCGPTAIAALTGTTTDRVAAIIREMRIARGQKRPAVRGVYTHEMVGALRRLGWHAQVVDHYIGRKQRPTLAQWHRDSYGLLKTEPRAIVEVTGHFVAVHGVDAVCSLQPGRMPAMINFAASARRRVYRAWIIAPINNGVNA